MGIKLTISIKGQGIELTVGEARELKDSLNVLFNEHPYVPYVPYYPVYIERYPSYPTYTPYTTGTEPIWTSTTAPAPYTLTGQLWDMWDGIYTGVIQTETYQ